MLFLRLLGAAALMITPISMVAAADNAALKAGVIVRDVNAMRLGAIDRVNPDGSIRVIFDLRFVTIPADKVVVDNKTVSTLLTKSEVAKLH